MGRGTTDRESIQGLLSAYGKDSGVPGRGLTWGAMIGDNLQVEFVHCHVQDKIVILEEGNRTNPHCPKCDMFVPWEALNRQNSDTALFARGEEMKKR